MASYEAILLSEDKSVKLVQLLGRVRQDWRPSNHSQERVGAKRRRAMAPLAELPWQGNGAFILGPQGKFRHFWFVPFIYMAVWPKIYFKCSLFPSRPHGLPPFAIFPLIRWHPTHGSQTLCPWTTFAGQVTSSLSHYTRPASWSVAISKPTGLPPYP